MDLRKKAYYMHPEDALLEEMDTPVDMEPVCMTLDVLASSCESSSSLAAVMRRLVQLARLEGPLRMLGTPTACDLPTFHHHLSALASQLNMLHDPKLIGEYLQSPSFSRQKYELFALQHMQLLVWLQRVQQGLLQGSTKTGEELTLFVQQIGHAARVLLFQPLLLHALADVQVFSPHVFQIDGVDHHVFPYCLPAPRRNE